MKCTSCSVKLENIVDVLQHDCDKIASPEEMNKDQRSLLTYIESCMVDKRGKLDHRKMNQADWSELKFFHALGILSVEDMDHEDSEGHAHKVTKFTDRAWELAKECRRFQAEEWVEHEVEGL